LRKQDIDFGEYINPDDIATELNGTYAERVAQAQLISDERRNACIAARRSFSFETVMSHPSKLEVLVRAKEAGFFVQMFFVGVDDPKTSVERVALRVRQGGHDVPEDRIINRWKRTMDQLQEAIRSTDKTFVFDNSAAGTISAVPRLVFRRIFVQSLPVHEQYPPIPDWVQYYVLEPLGIGPQGNNLRSVVTAPFGSSPATPLGAVPVASEFRSAPQDIEAEQAILGAILLTNNCYFQISEFLRAEHFYEPIHQRIFELAGGLILSGRLASVEKLAPIFPVGVDIAGLTVEEYLARLVGSAADAAQISQLGYNIRNLATRRDIIAVCEDVTENAYSAPRDKDVRAVLVAAERRLSELADAVEHQSDGPQQISSAAISAIDSIARAYSGDRELFGISTGLRDLDRVTGGLQRSDLVAVAGEVGVGKTSLASNIAYSVAKAWRGELMAS
jgi:predicted ABC-type ATPase